MPGRAHTPETRVHQGVCPEHSPCAAYAIWKVQEYWRAQKSNYNRSNFTIKPKPDEPEPVIPEGTRLCKRGHPQIPQNVRISPRSGKPACRVCDRERKAPKKEDKE